MNYQFSDRLREAELSRLASFLNRICLPAVGFITSETGTVFPNVTSKIGGDPDLPVWFDWPASNERMLDFVMQINLADVHPLAPDGLLPDSGLLSFFYDLENQPSGHDPSNLDGFRVLYHPSIDGLVASRLENPECKMAERQLSFYRTETLPFYGSRSYVAFETDAALLDHESCRYLDVVGQMYQIGNPTHDATRHRMFGHSHNIQGDMQLEAQFVTNGLRFGDVLTNDDPKIKELGVGADDWLLLLQLDSLPEVSWGDGGMLYFWIRRDDLLARRFEKVWMTLQCY